MKSLDEMEHYRVLDNKCAYYKYLANTGKNYHLHIVEEEEEEEEFTIFASFSFEPSTWNSPFNFCFIQNLNENQVVLSKIIAHAKKKVLPLPFHSFSKRDNETLINNHFLPQEKFTHMIYHIPNFVKSKLLPDNYMYGEITSTHRREENWTRWLDTLTSSYSNYNRSSIKKVLSKAICGKDYPLRHFYIQEKDTSEIIAVVSLFCEGGGSCGIYNIATLENYRNQKFGTKLLEYVHFDIARDQLNCSFSLVESNSRSISYFQKFGFKTIVTSTTWLRLKEASFPVRNIGTLVLMTRNGEIWMYVLLVLVFFVFIAVVKMSHVSERIKF
eukprot:gene7620-11943_t